MTDPSLASAASPMTPRELTPADVAKSLRTIADEHEQWAGNATTPSEAGYHCARMLVMRTAANFLDREQAHRQELERARNTMCVTHGEPLLCSKCQPAWRDIETAPKDEDVLLLYLRGSGVQPGYWDNGHQAWLAVETQGLSGGLWHSQPTHWQPLPPPPERQETEE